MGLEDFERMVTACAGTTHGIRDKSILLTLLDTGLRANELLGLELADLDGYTGEIRVRPLVGKGRKARSVFLGERGRRAIRAWVKVRGNQDGPLFKNASGGRLSTGLRQIRRCALAAGLEHEPPLHGFRRAFALNSLKNGADLLSISRILGHSTMSLLARYARQETFRPSGCPRPHVTGRSYEPIAETHGGPLGHPQRPFCLDCARQGKAYKAYNGTCVSVSALLGDTLNEK